MTNDRAFGSWYATNFYDLDEDDAIEAASIDGGNDGGIDFIHIDNENERIIVFQCHFPENRARKTPKKKFDALLASISTLEDPQELLSAGRADLADIAKEYLEKKSDYSIEMGLVSLGTSSPEIHRAVASAKKNSRYKDINFFYVSFEKIINQYNAYKSGGHGIEKDTISFVNGAYFEDIGEYGRALVGSILASDIKKLIEAHGIDLVFSRNIRKYLGARKGGINDQIKETVEKYPGKFWALNNGITIVAETATKSRKKGVFTLTNFSIVNGCQTSMSIYHAKGIEESSGDNAAKILVRIVAAKKGITDDIVRYNNTQNSIKIWTVRAADPIHNALREAFLKIRIAYAPKPGTKKIGTNIPLDKLAQYLAASKDLLIESTREKSELFDKHYQTLFPKSGISPEDVYLAWIVGNTIDEIRQTKLAAIGSLGDQEDDSNRLLKGLLGVTGVYWGVHCAYQIINALHSSLDFLSLSKMNTDDFKNAIKRISDEGINLYSELATDSYESSEYHSVRQALRSVSFLRKIKAKLVTRVQRIAESQAIKQDYLKKVCTSLKNT